MKYKVWAFPIVRVSIEVEAESHLQAMQKVDAETDFHALLDRHGVEWAEALDGFHVDEENDPEYERSCWYDSRYCLI